MLGIFKKLLDFNERELNRIRKRVDQINALEDKARQLKDEEIPRETDKLKTSIKSNEKSLDEVLPWAFALVREASRRTLGLRHFDEQMIAAVALHEGKVAEQKTGEGKTLAATAPMYLNALAGKGVHLVTVNDYLARRDAGWMGEIFCFLGLTVSSLADNEQSFIYDPQYYDDTATDWRMVHLRPVSRKEAYEADITYGVNSQFGFDYLYDNMSKNKEEKRQRHFHYAIIDEVDSVLIDEARTPHIISAPYGEDPKIYFEYATLVKRLNPDTDYIVDEKERTAHLTDKGITKLEVMLHVDNIYENNFDTVYHIEAALKAAALFKKDKDYIVKEGEVVIVDEFTGRLLSGRRYSEGIHQAIEAKEGVSIKKESKTLATVSLQNYFRMYEKLAGMTGTAATEAEEFNKIYKLEVIVVPTHQPMIRADNPDFIYKTERGKFTALVEEISKQHKKGRPMLVGTTSIEKNEILSSLLKKKGVKHELLNAKNHEREALIIAAAGTKGAVTVATNMAGRGVDIVLGGEALNKYQVLDSKSKDKNASRLQPGALNIQYKKEMQEWQKNHDEVVKLGGLYVIGTERHESRRIDNQLRGRSGRQGDPGDTRFFVSLEDDMMRIFGGEQVARLMTFFNIPENQPLEHAMVSKALEQAQVKVEGFNFDIRKNVVEYDDVLNKQREIFYGMRNEVLLTENNSKKAIEKIAVDAFAQEIQGLLNTFIAIPEMRDIDKFVEEAAILFSQEKEKILQLVNKDSYDKLQDTLTTRFKKIFKEKEKKIGMEEWNDLVRILYIDTGDIFWTDHLTSIEELRAGIGLRRHAQLDPLVEYKNEAFSMFERLLSNINYEFVRRVLMVQFESQAKAVEKRQKETPKEIEFKSATRIDPFSDEMQSTSLPEDQKIRKSQRQALVPMEAGNDPHVHYNPADQPFEISGFKVTPPSAQFSKPGRNDSCWCGSGKKYKKCHYPD